MINRQRRSDLCFVYAFLLPIFALFVWIRLIPILSTFITSFYKKSMIRPGQTFIGLGNYQYVLTNPDFITSMGHTAMLAAFSMLFSVVFGLFLASEVNSLENRAVKVGQTLAFLPVIVSLVPATLTWKMMFDYNFGILNFVNRFLGFPALNWVNDPKLTVWAIIIVGVWKEMGYNMMLFYVGLKAIPQELYESAAIDGVNHWQRFRYITIPMLRPITFFVLVMALIKFVKVFTQAVVMTQGNQSSGRVYRTIVYYIYEQGFIMHSQGRASAAAMLLLVVVVALTLLQTSLKKRSDY